MGIRNLFATDKALEKSGVWLKFADGGECWMFHVRRAGPGNARFQRRLQKKLQPHYRAIVGGYADPDEITALEQEVFAEEVVLDWEGVCDEAGAPIPFSKKAFVSLMQELPDLWQVIKTECESAHNFRGTEGREEAAGN